MNALMKISELRLQLKKTLLIILDLSCGEVEGIVELVVAQNVSGVWAVLLLLEAAPLDKTCKVFCHRSHQSAFENRQRQ